MPVDEQQAQTEQQTATSAGTQNTDTQATEAQADAMIPKARFDEINKRAKEAEKKLADLQKAAEEAGKSKLAEQQEFQKLYEGERKRADELAAKVAESQAIMKRNAIKQAIEREATTAKFADPADAHAFINLDAIELDEAGKPQGVNKLITDLAKTKPYLLAKTEGAPGNGKLPKPAGQSPGEQGKFPDKVSRVF